MPTRFTTTLVMVASLLMSAQAWAQIPDFQRGQVLRADQLNRMVSQINRNAEALGGSGGGATHSVACPSQTIADAMAQALSGDTIMITGTCNEAVVVDKDDITLDGGGSAVIDAAGIDRWAIDVTGHQKVTIKGLTVQNGHAAGIMITESSGAWLQDVTVRNTRRHKDYEVDGYGIGVGYSSSVVLAGAVAADNNAGHGILVINSSSALVWGNSTPRGSPLPPASVQANGNGEFGILIVGSSSFGAASHFGDNTTVQAKNNTNEGIAVHHGSSVLMIGTDVVATDNQGSGLDVGASSACMVGSATTSETASGLFASNGANGISVWGDGFFCANDGGLAVSIEATGNMGDGLWIYTGGASFFSPASNSTSSLVFSNNGNIGITVLAGGQFYSNFAIDIMDNSGNGIGAWANAHVGLDSTTTITGNNGDGVSAWNGVSLSLDVATVTGSGGSDVSAGLGSRIGWATGSNIGSVYCDSSVLVFNNAACP